MLLAVEGVITGVTLGGTQGTRPFVWTTLYDDPPLTRVLTFIGGGDHEVDHIGTHDLVLRSVLWRSVETSTREMFTGSEL
jgi:hypothetical protein